MQSNIRHFTYIMMVRCCEVKKQQAKHISELRGTLMYVERPLNAEVHV